MTVVDLAEWLRRQCLSYRFDIAGVFRRDSEVANWPVRAEDASDLERQLVLGGHLLPLPKKPAALANVLEVSIVDFIVARLHQTAGAEIQRGSERGYPDLEVAGPVFGAGYHYHAVDVKAARRDPRNPRRTQSRITLYTGNTYFRHPDLHWPGCIRPFNQYASHLDVLMIYTLNIDTRSRVEDLEIIVQEPWRIASRDRSSTTREYIGAVADIDSLREGVGAFSTPGEFYKYWRSFPFKVSAQVQRQYERLLALKMKELERLRGAQPVEPAQ